MSVLGALMVCLFGTLQASVVPEDFDQTVLLQRKFTTSSHAITNLQGPLELTQDTMAEQLDEIQQLLQEPDDDGDSEGEGDGNGSDSGSPPLGDAGLQTVRNMLETQMEAYLQLLHTAAESDWQTATDHSIVCGTHRARRFDNITGDVVLAERAMHQARLKHRACRQSEKAWTSFHAMSMSYSPPVDLAVHNMDAAAVTFTQAVTIAQSLAQTYNDIAPEGMHECLVDQTSLETSYCTWAAKVRETCNAYTTCTAGVGLADLRNRLLVDSSARRALWRTIGMLKCRLDEMLASSDGAAGTDDAAGSSGYADTCANITVSTAHLVLQLPLPQPNDCTDEQLPPLTSPSTENTAQCAVWMGTEYTWDPSDAVVPVACAATCLGVHTPQPPSDCEDISVQCKFYQLHPSACGTFPADGQAFEACTDCCYCRFSPACGHCPPGHIIRQGGTACQECPEGQIPDAASTSCVEPEPCVASVDCSGHGTTEDLDRSDGCSCSCANDYSGVSCGTPPSCDAAVDCSGHGATIDLDRTDGCDCACDEGFEGTDCAATTSRPSATGTAVDSGFEYYPSQCVNSGPGYLARVGSKYQGHCGQSGIHWNVPAFDTRTDFTSSGPGPRGIRFQCGGGPSGTNALGFQSSKRVGGFDTLPSQPATWEPVDPANPGGFKQMYDAMGIESGTELNCIDSGCAGSAYRNGFDFGVICQRGQLKRYWQQQLHWERLAMYTDSSIIELLLDGNQIKWYMDGNLLHTETGLQCRSWYHQWDKDTFEIPFWLVAIVGSPERAPNNYDGYQWPASIWNLTYITAPGVIWQA